MTDLEALTQPEASARIGALLCVRGRFRQRLLTRLTKRPFSTRKPPDFRRGDAIFPTGGRLRTPPLQPHPSMSSDEKARSDSHIGLMRRRQHTSAITRMSPALPSRIATNVRDDRTASQPIQCNRSVNEHGAVTSRPSESRPERLALRTGPGKLNSTTTDRRDGAHWTPAHPLHRFSRAHHRQFSVEQARARPWETARR